MEFSWDFESLMVSIFGPFGLGEHVDAVHSSKNLLVEVHHLTVRPQAMAPHGTHQVTKSHISEVVLGETHEKSYTKRRRTQKIAARPTCHLCAWMREQHTGQVRHSSLDRQSSLGQMEWNQPGPANVHVILRLSNNSPM